MASLDPRINPYRADIAAETLRDRVDAPNYVQGRRMFAMRGVAHIHKTPDVMSEQISQARYGDPFISYEYKNGWHWGQCARDGYVGYVIEAQLVSGSMNPTHRIKNIRSFMFAKPSIKSVVLDVLSFFSAVEVVSNDGSFAALSTGEYVHAHHITPIAEWTMPDVVFNAGRMLGIPYLWGGNTSLGFDCSGLVQIACEASGIPCPRDSDMQAAALGKESDPSKLHRGDIVFFPGHVGIMTDHTSLLHANAHHGHVVVEPLEDVVARGSKITGVRRLT